MTCPTAKLRIVTVAFAILMIVFAPRVLVYAQSGKAGDDDPAAQERAREHVEAGRDVLNDGFVGSSHPWYSSETDDATLIPMAPPKAQPTGDPWYQFIIDFFEWLIETGFTVTIFGRQYKINLLMMLMAAIVLTPIIWLLVKLYLNRSKDAKLSKSSSADDEERTDAQRVEALPFDIAPADNLLDVARKFAATERYADAIIYLFSHQLVELDRAHFIRLTKGKTNRQYLREIQTSRLRALMEQTTVAFEDAFFGHYEINKARFEECWARIDEFQALVWSGRSRG